MVCFFLGTRQAPQTSATRWLRRCRSDTVAHGVFPPKRNLSPTPFCQSDSSGQSPADFSPTAGRTELRKFSWAPAGLVSLAAAPAPLLNLRWHVWPEGCSFSGSAQLGAQRRGANFRGRIAERSQTSGRVWNGSPPGAAVVAKSFQ